MLFLCITKEVSECPVWSMGPVSTQLFNSSCGTILSPNFPGQVQQGLWFWTFQPPPNHYITLTIHYVMGPGVSDPDCQQYFKGRLHFILGKFGFYV